MTRAVHQLLPSYGCGDAIGGAVGRTQAMLRRLGFRSDTFASAYDRRLAQRARPADELLEALGPGDAVLYHLSIGSPVAELFEACGATRVIVYHNITPPQYYAATSQEVTYWLERGRTELRRLAPKADLVIADSGFNAAECRGVGARRVAVVPPLVDLSRLHPRVGSPERPPQILFVGRTAPNKRHDTLLLGLAALRGTAIPDAQLVVIGTSFDTGAYVSRLWDLAERLGVAHAVHMQGDQISDARLTDAYARASVFACASAHEGFCVPLLEAMAFDLPIVALAAGAVPDTLGGAGLLLDDRDPLVWATALGRVVEDRSLRGELIARGRKRLGDFGESLVEPQLTAALRDVGITP